MNDVTYTCWSEPERYKRNGEAIIHAQGEGSKTVCGVHYAALWQFQWWDGPWEEAVGCLRCRRVLARRGRGGYQKKGD